MRKNILKTFSFLLLSMTLLLSCCDCRDRNPSDEKKPYYLNFNCGNQNDFQPLHLDLVNGIGIMGQAKLTESEDKLAKIQPLLKEVGACDRYYIQSITYLKKDTLTNPNNVKHHIRVKLEKKTGASLPVQALELEKHNVFEKHIINIHIWSESDKKITSVLLDENGNLKELKEVKKLEEDNFVDFGTEFCRSKVIIGG